MSPTIVKLIEKIPIFIQEEIVDYIDSIIAMSTLFTDEEKLVWWAAVVDEKRNKR